MAKFSTNDRLVKLTSLEKAFYSLQMSGLVIFDECKIYRYKKINLNIPDTISVV